MTMDRQRPATKPKEDWASAPVSWALTALRGLCEDIGGLVSLELMK